MAPKVSVLMPSLNVAGYIDQCMESVLSQTLGDMEVICIDAGSTDGTLERLRHYAQADDRVTVLVSDVRSYGHQMNMGLDAAHGEYVGIVETDDWAEPQMFERLWHAATEHDADLVKANYYNHWGSSAPRDEKVDNLAACPYEVVFSPLDQRGLFGVAPSIWSGLYRRQMLLDEGIRFNETPGASYQDTSFFFMACSVARRAYLLEEPLLHYRRDNESSSVNSGGKVFCICDEMRYFEGFLGERPELRDVLIETYLPAKFDKYRWNYGRIDSQHQWDFLDRMYGEFSAHQREGLINSAFFNVGRYRELRRILDDRVSFFADTCKSYVTRPRGDRLPAALWLAAPERPDAPVGVSVIVRMGDRADVAQECLQTLLARADEGVEVICVCDGSGEDVRGPLVRMAADDGRVRVLSQVREGASAAWNHGVSVAEGEYVLFLDDGDRLHEGVLARMIELVGDVDVDVMLLGCSDPQGETSATVMVEGEGQCGCLAILGHEDDLAEGGWALLAKRAFIDANRLRLPDGCGYGKLALALEALALAERACAVPGCLASHGKGCDTPLERIYGAVSSVPRIQELAGRLPLDARLQGSVAQVLETLADDLRKAYEAVSDKGHLTACLAPVERQTFEALLDHARAADMRALLKQARESEREAKDDAQAIRGSVSFRLGRAVTGPLRAVRDLVKRGRWH